MRATKIIVGLGNPGPRYAATRHNIGFMAIGALADRLGAPHWRGKTKSYVRYDYHLEKADVIILWPMLFMNLSGDALVSTKLDWKKHQPNLLVVCDDVNIPFGMARMRGKGSAGGQKGLKNIIERVGTQDIARLRLGVGQNPALDLSDYVLSNFDVDEKKALPGFLEIAVDAVECFINDGVPAAMNKFNNVSAVPENKA